MTEEVKKEVVTITPFEVQKSELQELVKDYTNLVVTKDNVKEMNEKRLVLYRKRIEIQRVEKENNDALNKAKKINSERSMELVAIIQPHENKIDTQVKAIENAEKTRVQSHKNNIQGVKDRILKVSAFKTLEELNEFEKVFLEWKVKYNAEEFLQELNAAADILTQSVSDKRKLLELEAKIEAEKFVPEPVKEEPVSIPNSIKSWPSNIDPEQREMALRSASADPIIPKEVAPTFEEKAKNGDFSISVAKNFTYMGYSFHIDPKLGDAAINNITGFIKNIITSMMGEEEL